MGRENEPGGTEPYARQTAANTDASWTDTGVPVDVDLAGLRDYAAAMLAAQQDLAGRTGHLKHLAAMPHDAWDGPVLGEAAYVRSQMTANAGELTAYLQMLGQTLFNIGSAAQTVADSYQAADGTSAAELSAVLFAYGESGAARPAGLPEHIGRTYLQALYEDGAGTAPAAGAGLWSAPVASQLSPYQVVHTSHGPGGQRRELTVTQVSGGPRVETTVVYDRAGQVLSSSSVRTTTRVAGDTTTVTVETYSGGQRTGTSTTVTETAGGREVRETTSTVDGAGRPTGGGEEVVDPATGERTTTTYTVDDEGRRVPVERIVVGPETPGQPGTPEPIAQRYSPYGPGGS